MKLLYTLYPSRSLAERPELATVLSSVMCFSMYLGRMFQVLFRRQAEP